MKKWAHIAILLIWAVSLTIYLSLKTGGHLLSFHQPDDLTKLLETLEEVGHGMQGEFHAYHFVYEQCSCANALLSALNDRGVYPGWQESIIFGGTKSDKTEALEGLGFHLIYMEPKQIERDFGVKAVPLLLVVKEGAVSYIGGYYDRPANYQSLDRDIFARIINEETVESLPLYGCALDL